MSVPLVAAAVEILKRRQREQAGKLAKRREKHPEAEPSPYVFPARCGSKGYLSEPKKPWDQIREETGMTDLRIHDLRRSLGSWQAAAGANLSVIGKTLGHTNTSTTAIYARLNLDPVRQAIEVATSVMLAADSQTKPKKKRKGKGR